MKILHINTSDIIGGAARAAHRIHKGLLANGIDSAMLVQIKKSNEPEIKTTYRSKFGKMLAFLRPFANSITQKMQKTSNPILHSSNILPSGLHRKINNSGVDIVHLHWVNGEMISIREISKIEKPIVWTLHDMWVFSGAEHYDYWKNPGRYSEGYKKSNRPKNYIGLDIDRWTWNRKKKHWRGKDFNFVTPSLWLADCLKISSLFQGEEVTVIPNGLDTTMFKPINSRSARNILNLPQEKKIILYGATGAESNPIKGYQKLIEAKERLLNDNETDKLFFVVFGNDYKRKEEKNGVTTQYMGRIDEDITLSLIYSSADVMVVPSIMEAFGQTASEAMACGTPVVAFDSTGPKDIIDHEINGYLANPMDSGDLAKGIKWILGLSNEDYNRISKMGREKVKSSYDMTLVAEKYKSLYKSILLETS